MTTTAESTQETWPLLQYAEFRDTRDTLHLWTQIVGKVRVALTPWLNHQWHSALYVTARGLSTSPIPFRHRSFEIEFDFIRNVVEIRASDGHATTVNLSEISVSDFHAAVLSALHDLDIDVQIHGRPNEIPDAIPFCEDRAKRTYDPDQAWRLWQALLQVDRVFKEFRTGFVGKASPVHFFWGSFDLAVSRFSGRTAPLHPGGFPGLPDTITREAYSHEVSSAGFWFGGGPVEYPAFYSYAYPPPPGFGSEPARPPEAFFHEALGEFLLPYDAVRDAEAPDEVLLSFLQSTYEAAATRGEWNRAELECPLGRPGVPRPIS